MWCPPNSSEELRALREELRSALNGKYPLHELWFDLPQEITVGEAAQAIIQDPDDTHGKRLRDVFRVDEWLTAYASNKARAFVFCPGDEAVRKEVGLKAAELLHDKFGFSFDRDRALAAAKIR